MASSGTISTTIYESRNLIDRAYGRCRLRPQQIVGELLTTAQTNLYLILSDLVNTGIPVWCLDRQLTNFNLGSSLVTLPVGSVDIRNAFYRTLSPVTTATPVLALNSISWNFVGTGASGPLNISITWSVFPTGPMLLQTSADGTTWFTQTTLPIPAAAINASQLYWYDTDGIAASLYYRIIPSTGTFTPSAVSLFSQSNDVLMYRMNADDFELLPNKTFQGRPLQYWTDRTVTGPVMRVWPVPDLASSLLPCLVYRQRYIQDVGSLPQTIEVPQYWYEALTWKLASNLAWEIPEVDKELIPLLEQKAAAMMKLSWNQDRDKSPIKISYNISAYTK
jgi:hypothetical protein